MWLKWQSTCLGKARPWDQTSEPLKKKIQMLPYLHARLFTLSTSPWSHFPLLPKEHTCVPFHHITPVDWERWCLFLTCSGTCLPCCDLTWFGEKPHSREKLKSWENPFQPKSVHRRKEWSQAFHPLGTSTEAQWTSRCLVYLVLTNCSLL
jgi:hypothetical protein